MKKTTASLLILLLLPLALLASGEPDGPARLLDEVLTGKITHLDGDEIEIRYDFSEPDQLEDWMKFKPFRVAGELDWGLDGERLRMKTVGALHHHIIFTGEVELECDFTPRSDRDLGLVVAENAEGDQFVLYSINDIHFQKFDGAKTPQHMVTRFGVRDTSDGPQDIAFRYVARGTEPKIQTHRMIRLLASKEGKNDVFHLGETVYKGKDPGRPMQEMVAGIYVVKSSCLADNIRVRGRISPRWLEKHNVELAVSKPIEEVPEEPTGPTEEDLAAQEKLRRFTMGLIGAEEIIEVLGEPRVNEGLRQEGAAALIAGGDKKIVPQLVTLLYSEDEIARRLGDEVVTGLTGKRFGYSAKADEDKRSRAIQKLIQYIQKNPRMFGSGR